MVDNTSAFGGHQQRGAAGPRRNQFLFSNEPYCDDLYMASIYILYITYSANEIQYNHKPADLQHFQLWISAAPNQMNYLLLVKSRMVRWSFKY